MVSKIDRVYPTVLIFVFVIFSWCSCNAVFAGNDSILGNWKKTKDTSYPSSCNSPQLELFSCQLNSGGAVALCMNQQPRSLEFRIRKGQTKTAVIAMNNVYQVVSSASAGGATILRGKTKENEITLYFDENYADDSSSNILLPDNTTITCEKKSTRDPEHLIPNEHNKMQFVDIWSLLSLGITKPFFIDVTDKVKHDKDMRKLWHSWPN